MNCSIISPTPHLKLILSSTLAEVCGAYSATSPRRSNNDPPKFSDCLCPYSFIVSVDISKKGTIRDKTDLKTAHEDLHTIQMTLKDAQDEKQKSKIQKYGEHVCKVVKNLVSSRLGYICDVGVYCLVEIVV